MNRENKCNYFIIVLIIPLFVIATSAFAHCCPGPCCADKPVTFQKLIKEQKTIEEQRDKESFIDLNRKAMR